MAILISLRTISAEKESSSELSLSASATSIRMISLALLWYEKIFQYPVYCTIPKFPIMDTFPLLKLNVIRQLLQMLVQPHRFWVKMIFGAAGDINFRKTQGGTLGCLFCQCEDIIFRQNIRIFPENPSELLLFRRVIGSFCDMPGSAVIGIRSNH